MKKRLTGYLFLIFVWLCAVQADALYLRVAENKLTLHADQVHLQDILQKLADTGITIRIDPQLNPKISAAFDDWEIQRGIGSILKGHNHILIWKSVANASAPVTELSEIQVFRPGEKERMKILIPRSNLRVERNPIDGSLFTADELLLKIKPELRPTEVEKLLKILGGVILDRNKALGIYKIRLPEGTDVPYL